jgi:rubrerythrin
VIALSYQIKGGHYMATVKLKIADEERRHVGELQQLLYMISPREAEHTEKGRQKIQQQQAQNFQASLQ